MLDKMLEKNGHGVLKAHGLRTSGYVLVIGCGMFIGGFSIANIGYIYLNDQLKLLGSLLLWGYLVLGVITIHVCARFFSRMMMLRLITGLVVVFTTATTSLFALQMSVGYWLVQVIYTAVTLIQLLCLVLVVTNVIPSLTLTKKRMIFYLYAGFTVLYFAVTTIPPMLNGDGRWSRNKPGHVGWYKKTFGEEIADMLMGPLTAVLVVGLTTGVVMWIFFYVRDRYYFENVFPHTPVSGYLFYLRDLWGYKGGWGYRKIGSRDLPDFVAFIREENGRRYFKKEGTTSRLEEELIISKEEGMEEGVFSCKVIGKACEPRQVMVLREESLGKWRPYEFEQIESETKNKE
ncbi:hypothetical protein NSQ26_13130 [Bacillus sp. FSL W7-1360]